MSKKGILERLAEGVVIGDGGYVFALEKRGYVKAGPWTPEAVVEHPEAVRQLHREFLRAGSDVMQSFTFYASEDKLENRGNVAAEKFTCAKINESACELSKEVAAEGGALTVGSVSQTPTYLTFRNKQDVQNQFKKQVEMFVKNNIDFLICEYFEHIEEIEWAIEVLKTSGKPVGATMCIGPEGDLSGVPAGECAVRMHKAGADIVGVNCHFDPFVALKTMKLMKEALDAAKLKPFLMCQPLAYLTPDAGRQGFVALPEFPFALEPRVCTRLEMQKYAREAFNLGIRYIGGCCGFEPYHIRAIAEELAVERGDLIESPTPWETALKMSTKPWLRARANRSYWENLNPATGRPFSASLAHPDEYVLVPGTEAYQQHKEETTDEQVQKDQQSFGRKDK